MARIADTYEYTVLKVFLPAFINDDLTGLEDSDVEALDRFHGEFNRRFLHNHDRAGAHLIFDYKAEDMDDTWFTTDEITGLKGDCFRLYIHVMA